jgi:antitoxin (DNA-binding transcriptional repressor) of toxin-antitoxin stability system
MKRVTISELQADLVSYLARATAGETVVVCDREKPVATIAPLERGRIEARESWGSGSGQEVIEPTISINELEAAFENWHPITLSRDVDPLAILDDLREDRE